MSSPITLSCQLFRCEILPHSGGCIAGLWLGDTPVLRPSAASALATARQSACYPLVPFSNRIGHARLHWDGQDYPLQYPPGDEPHAIHGAGWQRPWRVVASDAQSAQLAYAHQPDHLWPFAFEAVQTFRLSANALDLTLRMDNHSDRAVPVGLGWHPFFVKRRHSHLSFDAAGRWEMDAEKLPTQRRDLDGIDADCAALEVDHCYDGWPGVVHLRDELLHTRITSSLNHLVVFTDATRNFVAIEPVSHVNNAFNLTHALGVAPQALGAQVLQAGQSFSAAMRIHVTAAGDEAGVGQKGLPVPLSTTHPPGD